MWIIWALLSAMFAATRRINEKKLTTKLHPLTISFMTELLSLPVIITTVFLRGDMQNPFDISWKVWLILTVVCVGFYPLNSKLYLGAVKHGELSKVLPIQSLWPVFSIVPAWIFLHETPGIIAVIGIALIVCGVYVLGLKGGQLHHPLQPFREDKSSRYMLLAVLLITVVGVLNKIALTQVNATFYALLNTVGAVVVLFITMKIKKVNELHPIKSQIKNLALVGSLQGGTFISYLLALSLGPIAYVSAIRSSNILMGALLGIVIFKERLTKPKITSLILILIGGIVLAVGS